MTDSKDNIYIYITAHYMQRVQCDLIACNYLFTSWLIYWFIILSLLFLLSFIIYYYYYYDYYYD